MGFGLFSSGDKKSTSVSQGSQQGLTVDQSQALYGAPVIQVTSQAGTSQSNVTINQNLTDYGAVGLSFGITESAIAQSQEAAAAAFSLARASNEETREGFVAAVDAVTSSARAAVTAAQEPDERGLNNLLLLVFGLAGLGAAAFVMGRV